MNQLAQNIKRGIAVYGEGLVLDTVSYPAVVRPMSPTEARTYLAQSLIDNYPRPIWKAVVPFDNDMEVGDEPTYQGGAVQVRFVRSQKVGTTVLAKVLVLVNVVGGPGGS